MRPKKVQVMVVRSVFLRPYLSANSPMMGAPINCPREKAMRKRPRIIARVGSDVVTEKRIVFGFKK